MNDREIDGTILVVWYNNDKVHHKFYADAKEFKVETEALKKRIPLNKIKVFLFNITDKEIITYAQDPNETPTVVSLAGAQA